MIEIISQVVDALQSRNILWMTVAFLVYAIANLPNLLKHLEKRKIKRINGLLEAYGCEHLDASLREFFKSELEKEYFFNVTDIATEQPYRTALIQLHQSAKGELAFSHFRRASQHLKFQNGAVRIKIDLWDRMAQWMNGGLTILFATLALLMMLIPAVTQTVNLTKALTFYIYGILFFSASLFALVQTKRVSSAKRIERFLLDREEPVRVNKRKNSQPTN